MKDFIKIFIAISFLVAAFMSGKNYGEKTFQQGDEYKSFLKEKEELAFSRSDLENVKAKLQNITDGAENKKTEELLAQILQVFLADLGLRIQNKEAILKQAQTIKEVQAQPLQVKTEPLPAAIEKKEPPQRTKTNYNKFKSSEWMISNSVSEQDALRALKKVEIKNINDYLSQSDFVSQDDCEQFLGVYKGSVKDLNKKYFGSMEFELKSGQVESKEQLFGKVAWYNNNKTMAEPFNKNCGKKIKNLSGRIFGLTADKYVQVYKLTGADKLAGNFYESLPNGTTKIIGSFVLNRVDKF